MLFRAKPFRHYPNNDSETITTHTSSNIGFERNYLIIASAPLAYDANTKITPLGTNQLHIPCNARILRQAASITENQVYGGVEMGVIYREIDIVIPSDEIAFTQRTQQGAEIQIQVYAVLFHQDSQGNDQLTRELFSERMLKRVYTTHTLHITLACDNRRNG